MGKKPLKKYINEHTQEISRLRLELSFSIFTYIFTVIKKIVDKARVPGKFLLSGSANFALLKNLSESLAGRAIYLNMSPMSRRELFFKTEEEPFLMKFFRTQKIESSTTSEKNKG